MMTTMLYLLVQGLAGLFVYQWGRRPLLRSWRRLRANPFARYTETLFLRRKAVMACCTLMVLQCMAIAASNMYDGMGQAGDWLSIVLVLAAGLLSLTLVGCMVAWTWSMFRKLFHRGLLNEFRLTASTPQDLLVPAFYRLTALTALGVLMADLAASRSLESASLLPLRAAAALACASAFVGYLFCAFNHGLGLGQTALIGVVIVAGLEIVLLPLDLWGRASVTGEMAELAARAFLFACVGRVFYVSFLRTDPAVWAGRLEEGSTRKPRMVL